VADLKWFVAHTKPRREKKLVEWCKRENLHAILTCYESPHKYRGKTVVFQKPLFPGYVFLHVPLQRKDSFRQNDNIANLLEVFDEQTFEQQLQQILLALESNVGVRLAPSIDAGMRVRIKSGPLQGTEGWVQERQGMTTVLLRLDFISQAAAIKLDANLLELI
jgi:transcription antitermination factor NusG